MHAGSLFGYTSLATLGGQTYGFPSTGLINFTVPTFTFGGHSYQRIGISEGGFAVPGGATVAEVNALYDDPRAMAIPDPAAPNPLFAPFMTPLYQNSSVGLRVLEVTQTTTSRQWAVFEWDLANIAGTYTQFQLWVGLNGTDDVSYAYDTAHPPVVAPGVQAEIGVENDEGNQGISLGSYAGSDYIVTATPKKAGGHATLSFTAVAGQAGTGTVTASFASNGVSGTLVRTTAVTVTS